MTEQPLSEAFDRIAQYALKVGARSIADLAVPWWATIDEHWLVAINGLEVAAQFVPSNGGMTITIPAYHAAVWYNGWLAAFLQPFAGTFISGSAGNEDTFIEAMDRALASLDDPAYVIPPHYDSGKPFQLKEEVTQ